MFEYFGKSRIANCCDISRASDSPIIKQNTQGTQIFPRVIVTSRTITNIVNNEKNHIWIVLYLALRNATARIPPLSAPNKNPTEKKANMTSASF